MSDITVKDFASMAIDEDSICEIWKEPIGTAFSGSFEEAAYSPYADSTVNTFSIEDGVFVMNI